MKIIQINRPKECELCGYQSIYLSKAIGVCKYCLRERSDEALKIALENHAKARKLFNLPPFPPRSQKGIKCNLCAAECMMDNGEFGYCGIRFNNNGKMGSLATNDQALLYYYLDPHVTNCCNAYFCPAGTGIGYPEYSYCKGPEYGYYNLALFFYGCSFNCLFCQNWNHKVLSEARLVHVNEIVNLTLKNEKISCWCWFGGSAEPQLPYAINASRKILELKPPKRIVRICFEWNGDGNKGLVKIAGELAYKSGGNVKFDLKAFNNAIHLALTGMDNKRVLENFELIYREYFEKRKGVPVLGATTLLVPHYIDAEEVEQIAKFIASLDDEIPYNLLIFHPDFMMNDIPVTPKKQIEECYNAAKKYLKFVNISNMHLIGCSYSCLSWGLKETPVKISL
jgi:pyruvate formate lyase activating enzyme